MHTSTPENCRYCGFGHVGTCHRVKAFEFYPDGSVKRVEFHAPEPVVAGTMPTHIIRVPDAPSSMVGNGYVSPVRT